ncbi:MULTISPECIES: hypothetical protein [Aneurinibacillus]|nr:MULTISPECIES: hypothetical protein [Aneurinibacillus]
MKYYKVLKENMRNYKKAILGTVVATMVLGSPVSSFAANAEETAPISKYVKLDKAVEEKGIYRTFTEWDGKTGEMELNFNSGEVKFNGEILPLKVERQQSNQSKSNFALTALPGYKYVGTLTGHTKVNKDSIEYASYLIGLYTKLGVGVITNILSKMLRDNIPDAYYAYDLYEKNPMTDNWYQYTETTFYTDSARKKKYSGPHKSIEFKVYLPNS